MGMKNKFYSIILLYSCLALSAHAQNLVPNPSFEDTVKCPTNHGDINGIDASNWLTFGSTPDYFNSCNNYPASDYNHGCSVPDNWAGFQAAATGFAYAGLGNAN